jgi:hypothetical protein
MPRIPGILPTERAPGPVNNYHASGADFGAQVGQGMQNLGHGLSQIASTLNDIYDSTRADKAISEGQKELQDYSFELEHGAVDSETGERQAPPPPEEHQKLFQEKVESIKKRMDGDIDGRALRMFDSHFTDFAARQELAVRERAIDRYNSDIRANLDSSLETDARTFVNSDELGKPKLQQGAFDRIDRMVHLGVLKPEEGLARKRQFVGDAQMASFMKINRTDPIAAIQAVQEGEFGDLPADTQQKMIDAGLSEYRRQKSEQQAEETRSRVENDRLQKETQETTSKKLWAIKLEKKLTPKMVSDEIDNLSREQYVALMKQASGKGDVETDPHTYAQLRMAAARGEDISERATREYSAGNINRDAYDGLLSKLDDSPGFTGKNVFKTGEKYLARALKQDPFVSTPSDEIRSAKAMDEWRSWMAENPKATQEEGQKKYQQLASDASIAHIADLETSHLMPTYLKRSSNQELSENLLKAAYKDAKKDFESKKLIYADFQQEVRRIQDLLNSLDTIKAAAPKKVEK